MSYSANWSGYVQAGDTGTFTGVEDTWTVPTVSTAQPGSQYSADWVGIGGFLGDSTLVQAGTGGNNQDGATVYFAWYEILPAYLVTFPMTINAGDSITTVVEEESSDTWLMQVTDNTTQVTDSQLASYSSSGRSVEAIHEATTVCVPACTIGTLATTTRVTFNPGSYTDSLQQGSQPLLAPAIVSQTHTEKKTVTAYAKLYKVLMTNTSDTTVIATPSAPNSARDGFSVADGRKAPPAT